MKTKNIGKAFSVNLYILFLMIFLCISVLTNLYNDLSASNLEYIVGDDLISFKKEFTGFLDDNIKLFSENPKGLKKDNHTIGSNGTFLSHSTIEERVYSILSYNKSWSLNRILLVIMNRGQLYMNVMGIIISTSIYDNINKKNKDNSINYILKNQIKYIIKIVFIILTIFTTLGFLLNIIIYNLFLKEMEALEFINNIYASRNIWKPNFQYNLIAILGAFLYLSTYGFVGFFIGHIFKDSLLSLLLVFLTSQYWFKYSMILPLTPLYFLHGTISNFIFILNGYIVTLNKYGIIYIIGLFITISVYLLLLKILLERRFITK